VEISEGETGPYQDRSEIVRVETELRWPAIVITVLGILAGCGLIAWLMTCKRG